MGKKRKAFSLLGGGVKVGNEGKLFNNNELSFLAYVLLYIDVK